MKNMRVWVFTSNEEAIVFIKLTTLLETEKLINDIEKGGIAKTNVGSLIIVDEFGILN